MKNELRQRFNELRLGTMILGMIVLALFLTSCKTPTAKSADNTCCGLLINPDPELYCKQWLDRKNEPICEVHNRTQEEVARIDAKTRKECYDAGRDHAYSFDIIKDYDLSCNKIAYINDHLIDKSRQVDGGYITGYYSGLVSYGHIEAQLYQYVTEGVLATGQLVKNISYHTDCKNSTFISEVSCWDKHRETVNDFWYCDDGSLAYEYFDTKVINYYSETDFVMYYVSNCIND